MNKYIEIIKENNSIIIKLLNEFNKLLLEEKTKNPKGKIKIKTIKDHYINTLFNEKEFKEYTIKISDIDMSFELKKVNVNNNVENGLFIDRAYFEINKKNNKVKVQSIFFKKNIENNISILYGLMGDSKTKDLNVVILLKCNETKNEKMFAIEYDEIKCYELPSHDKLSESFELNQKYLNSFFAIAKIDKEIFLDYLLLGKKMDKEVVDLLLLENDIDLKENNIFRIDFSNTELNVKSDKKMSLS